MLDRTGCTLLCGARGIISAVITHIDVQDAEIREVVTVAQASMQLSLDPVASCCIGTPFGREVGNHGCMLNKKTQQLHSFFV